MTHSMFRVGKVWHYRFQINGVRVQRSTRETVKHLAETIANRAYRHAKTWARGAEPVPTLHELVRQWIAAHESIVSPAYIRIVETFGRLHLYQLADVMADELSTQLVEAAMLDHRRHHAPVTVNHWLTILKVVCKWAVRRKVMPEVPWSVKPLKVQKKPRATLPVNRATQWIEAIDAYAAHRPEIQLAVRMMFGLGLRESEVITARWEWIDWERRTYTPGVTKGREADPVPIPRWLVDHLTSQRRSSGLIVHGANGKPLVSGFARRAMRAANATCEIHGLTPHRLRGTYATLLSERGLPIQTIQRVMRHKDPMTTMRYLEANLSSAVHAQASIARLAGLQCESKHGGEEVANDLEQTPVEYGPHK
ncbi:tyrosine-type recombinase/integrase [Paraburkholderia sp. BCC1884]|uniref:tyrosine-type recombinase/integrase n=1 Tax=Paraburkholderia sp. BCC1884 TaxID=2562668 RepID=UPI001183DF61|nr:site-specific integrase [Paraburkholderia sp. BCC1884]